jgi:hypothetical protein
VADQFKLEDNLFKEFAIREMESFKAQGKKSDLLEKALIT